MAKSKLKHATDMKQLNKRRRYFTVEFLFSVISLLVVMAIFVTSSFSWFSIKTAKLNATNFKLECGKGLRVNDSGTTDFEYDDITRYISPASSVDGRNLFFPTDGSDFSSKTKEITYRSANAGDKNLNYVQIDFTLTAQANNTALYINEEKTYMRVAGQHTSNESATLAAPLRMAIWSSATDSDDVPRAPVVFNPTGKTYTIPAVENVDRASGKMTGSPGRQTSHAFSDYTYGGEPVTVLSKGVETRFSVIIWLEGADPKCTYDKVSLKDIHMGLAFSTSWDKTQVIRFVDDTPNHWVTSKMQNDHYGLVLRYEKVNESNPSVIDDSTDFNMYKYDTDGTNPEYMCNMPGDMSYKLTFLLVPPTEGAGDTYIFWQKTDKNGTVISGANTYDRDVNRVYTAKTGSGTPANCGGYWIPLGDSEGAGHDVGDGDGDDF